MHLKSKRLAAIVLAMTLLFQTAGCLGTANGFEGKPADTIYSLQSAVQSLNDKDILALTTIEKGSSRYKEYSDILNMDSYTEGAAKCYEAVASAIDVTYDEDSIETGKDIAKVPVTFAIPAWKDIFENSSLSGADSVIEALAKAEKENTTITLRLINTKNGLVIKNADELFEIFDFVGYEIAALAEETDPSSSGEPDPTGESDPTGEPTLPTDPSFRLPTDPNPTESDHSGSEATETSRRETEPTESSRSTEPSETPSRDTGSTAPTGGKESKDASIAKAYADYAKRLKENKDGIEWYQRNVNSNACGLADFTGDDIPDLYYFTKGSNNSNFSSFFIYSYDPAKQKTSMILLETLNDPSSKISEFFVLRTKDNKIVTYTGYLDDNGSITTYNIYTSRGTGHFMDYTGKMFLTLGPEVKDKNGKDMTIKVCTVQGVDKYTTQTVVEVDEFRRIEKDILGSTASVFSANFQKKFNSVPYQLIGNSKLTGLSYNDLLKKLDS